MVFLDPTIDVAFKKVFGDKNHKDILISFLNSALERKDGEKIIAVTINDPNNYPEFVEPQEKQKNQKQKFLKSKYSIVDVSATDETGKNYIIEVQISNQDSYGPRTQYYSSVAVSRQLASTGQYPTLTPVIFIGILCFNLFDDKDFLSHHLILNKKTHTHGLRLMEWHFIELPKFTKELNELKNIIDEWCFFLKNIKDLNEMPKKLQHTDEIRKAMEILNEATWTPIEIYNYEKQRDIALSEKGKISLAKSEGKAEEKQAIAQAMLTENFDIKLIAKLTGLSLEEVKALKKK